MAAAVPLRYLSFELSLDTDGVHTLEAEAATADAAGHAAVMAEVDQVLAWAARHFPDGPGPLDEGARWCHDLLVDEAHGWQTVSLNLSGTTEFADAFAQSFTEPEA